MVAEAGRSRAPADTATGRFGGAGGGLSLALDTESVAPGRPRHAGEHSRPVSLRAPARALSGCAASGGLHRRTGTGENFHRGGALSTYEAETDRLLDQFRGLIDYRAAVQTWRRALGSHWEGSPVWVHGDVAPGNLLVRDGQLHAVIDFGQFAAGDPSCDLTVAWTLLDEAGRAVFRSRLQLDDLVWQRARGWALWKQLLDLESALSLRNGSARRVHDVLQVIGEISAPPD